MKVSQLLTEEKTSLGSKELSYNYAVMNAIDGFGSAQQVHEMNEYIYDNKDNPNAASEFLMHKNQESQLLDVSNHLALLHFKENGDVLISQDFVSKVEFTIFDLDRYGPPPFKLGGGQLGNGQMMHKFTILGDTETLEKPQWWWPSAVVELHLDGCGIQSLSGFDEHVKVCSSLIMVDCHNFKGRGLLSLLKSKVNDFYWGAPKKLVVDLVNEYLKAGDGDIFGLQSELIEAGFPECATL